ncbi:MAG TPA: tripartite tricarboxylate transporter substrate binding protein [Casimicrobiaceae bacterium]|nr:tripartite tricarboxylate transporter substrate binding protein [Casimicrobiaceae bacterium]
MKMIRSLTSVFALTLAIVVPAFAQGAFPTKPIRLVVPFAPGGSSEIIARSLAAGMAAHLGQAVYVDNKPGGSGNIAMEEVKRAAADGYTLILGHVGTLAVNPALFGNKLPYDANKDFTPISMVARVPNVIAVNPQKLSVTSLKEFVDLAKKQPGKINYGTAGNGSAGHLAMEYFKSVAKIDVQHVPYKGTGPMLTDLLGGQIEMTFNGIPPISGQLKSGKIKPIAVGAAQRVSSFPDVPTIAESGYPGFETSQWYGIMAPANVPQPVLDRLHASIVAALKSKESTQKIVEDGGLIVGDTPREFAELIAKEQGRWGTVVRNAGIKPE